jgi:hypothetical protein
VGEYEAAHEREFLETVGQSVLRWQFVESGLFLLFSQLVRARDHHVASAIYHAVIGLNGKIAMIDAAADCALVGTEFFDQWRALKKRVEEKARERNVLVHFSTLGHLPDDPLGKPTLRLARSIFDVRSSGNRREYSLEELKRFGESFVELASDLDVFIQGLGWLPART